MLNWHFSCFPVFCFSEENSIGEQCSSVEENLRKNNSKRAYQLVKDLTTVKQGKNYYCPRSFRKMLHRRTRDIESMDRILHSAVQSQGQWRSISTGLSPDRNRGWPLHPSQRRRGCSTIAEEKLVSWSGQHPNRTSPNRWRWYNHRSHNNLQKIWQTGKWPTPWTQSLVITLPRKVTYLLTWCFEPSQPSGLKTNFILSQN